MVEQRRQWHPTPVLLPGKSHGRGNLVGCSPGVTKSRTRLSDFTFTFHFSLSCIGEGNGNPLQCSCLENPRDGGAWWAAVYGVAQSRTQLKRLSSSSSSINGWNKWTHSPWNSQNFYPKRISKREADWLSYERRLSFEWNLLRPRRLSAASQI